MVETKKVCVEFDGWHCLSRKQRKEILAIARENFVNANFCNDKGMILEDSDNYKIHKYCLDIIESFKTTFRNWDGYKISSLSKRTTFNYNDRKRKLNFEYFKILINEELQNSKLVLAGILYLDPEETLTLLTDFQREHNKLFKDMNEDELDKAYKMLILYASSKIRNFAL